MTWFIGAMGSITHIVNNVGAAVNSSNKTSFLTSYGSAGSGCSAAPSAPSGLTATAASSSQINLSWTASTAGSGCSITYNVFRSTTSGFTPSSSNQIHRRAAAPHLIRQPQRLLAPGSEGIPNRSTVCIPRSPGGGAPPRRLRDSRPSPRIWRRYRFRVELSRLSNASGNDCVFLKRKCPPCQV